MPVTLQYLWLCYLQSALSKAVQQLYIPLLVVYLTGVPNLLHKCTWVLSRYLLQCMEVTVYGRHLPEVGVLSYTILQYIH